MTTKTVTTLKFMLSNSAYTPTVYKTWIDMIQSVTKICHIFVDKKQAFLSVCTKWAISNLNFYPTVYYAPPDYTKS